MFFSQKPEYKEYMMSYKVLQPDEETVEGMGVDLIAFATVDGKPIYCFATYYVPAKTTEEYDEIIKKMLECDDKKIRVRLKYKKGKIKNFRIDVPSIAGAYQDERLGRLELLGWGLHDSWPVK